jgi:hypothetical protein
MHRAAATAARRLLTQTSRGVLPRNRVCAVFRPAPSSCAVWRGRETIEPLALPLLDLSRQPFCRQSSIQRAIRAPLPLTRWLAVQVRPDVFFRPCHAQRISAHTLPPVAIPSR